jgi:hypothetical protein
MGQTLAFGVATLSGCEENRTFAHHIHDISEKR